jgi:ribonucleoside-diphosphate reductase alpha chain
MNLYSAFIHLSRYSRYRPELGRRETWAETVQRTVDFWKGKYPELAKLLDEELKPAIYNMEVLPSMRALWTAGPALDQNNFRGYNCSAVAIDSPRVFDEALYILMSGTGLGFSAESKYTNKLPIINDNFVDSGRTIVVEDSSEGWAKALRKHIADLYLGRVHSFDLSKLRPEGAKLKTMGGRSSGPAPLQELLDFTEAMFRKAAGRKLSPLECHELMCKIGEVVVVGGVRRSALISLSDLNDNEIRDAKSGNWWVNKPHLALSNNSATYYSKPSAAVFMDEWTALIKSGSGERGIYNQEGAKKKAKATGRRDASYDFLPNPCAEILLRYNGGLCNLSTIVLRNTDTLDDIRRKLRLAAILGTLQATLTNFPYVRDVWRKNAEEERLLGVSATGIQDSKLFREMDEAGLAQLKDYVNEVNREFAAILNIAPAAASTAIKPEGTVSQLTSSGSGIHAWFSEYFIRRVRMSHKDPLTQLLIDQGVPNEVDVMNPRSVVFSYPQAAPEGAIIAGRQTAIEQLENWLVLSKGYTEHNPSVTIYVKDDEWVEVGAWVYKNFDYIVGVSFLPYSDHTYKQAPYEAITKEQYEQLTKALPEVDFSKLPLYELEDETTGSQTLACVAGGCEV